MRTSILPIPATLLCGFLGSGKTTRINSLIASGELTNALFLINDFGRINIDAELIESQEDHILRLTNGCACCGIAGNLSAQLRGIRRWPTPPTHLVFEASGIARPRPLMQLLDAAHGFRLEHAETLIDASAFTRHYTDTAVKDIVVDQIREVTQLRINRINWLTEAQREQVLQSIVALNPTAGRTLEKAEKPAATSQASSKARGSGPLVTESVEFANVIDLAALEALLSEASTTLVRAKGLVQANDHAGSYHVIQLAGGRLTRTATRAHQSRALVVIGYPGTDMDRLIASLRAL